MAGLALHEGVAGEGVAGVDELLGREGAAALLALVAVGAGGVAVGALADDVAVGEELVGLLVVELLALELHELVVVVELAEEVAGHLAVCGGGGAAVDVERDAEVAERLADDLVVAVHDILGRAALFLGADGDGHAVLVAAADEEHVLALQAQVADVDVGGYVDAGQMADVDGAVGVGQGARHESSLEFLFFHIVFVVSCLSVLWGVSEGAAVEAAVGDGLGDVGCGDGIAVVEVGDGARHLQYAVVGACREVQPYHGLLQQPQALGVGLCVVAEQGARHLGVAVDAGHRGKAALLPFAGAYDALAHGGAALADGRRRQLAEGHGSNLALQVEAVHEGAADAAEVALHLCGRADAGTCGMVVVAAGAGVHGCYHHEVGGVVHGGLRAADGDVAVFERLPQHLQHVVRELGQLIQEIRLVP